MADHTHIEWTDATWNPVTGCSVVSPGCTNCYAMKLAGTRLQHHRSRYGLTVGSKAGPVWNGEVRFNAEWLDQPLRWKRPRKIFVCAHGDLFHENVPDEWIDRVFAVMALCPQHTFQVLTKRADRMREYLAQYETRDRVMDAAYLLLKEISGFDHAQRWSTETDVQWPLPNVWLGVSVEDQARADERIPDLLGTPAAVRFLSCEPLLGTLNIRPALRPVQPFAAAELPDRWADFKWPEWVPDTVAARVMDFWNEGCGRNPRTWLKDAITQGGPALWSAATLRMLTNAGDRVSGRFVHMWNNIGCVVQDGGVFVQGSFTGSGVYSAVIANGRGLDWVIVGGESGPNARPMHPDWARSLRDQCFPANVPFFFKQWGNWEVSLDRERDDPDWRADYMNKYPDRGNFRWINLAGGRGFHGERFHVMRHVGKKSAGRLLDGVQHSAFPQVRA